MAQGDGPRRPTGIVLRIVLLFLVAVVLGRLLVAGGRAWVLFAFALPIVLAAGSALVGWRAALAGTVVFTGVVLSTRWLLHDNPSGWIGLLLLPVVALTALVVGKVLALLRQRPADAAGDEPAASTDDA